MTFAHDIKQLVQGDPGARDLAPDQAAQLFGAMLDGGVPEFELGALLVALRMKGETLGELLGYHEALVGRVHHLIPPEGDVRPVVLGTYNGAKHEANLTPLVAMLLARIGVPVLVHGTLEGHGCIASAYIFRELGVLPCTTLGQAQAALDRDKLAFVPTAVLSPGLAGLLALRNRLGIRNSSHTMAKFIDPFGGASLRVVGMSHLDVITITREFFLALGERAVLFHSAAGEPFANPRQRPRIEYFDDGRAETLFADEHVALEGPAGFPEVFDVKTTAAYTRKVLEGHALLPLPIVNEVAACLYGASFTADFNQAKAIAAVQTHNLAAA